MLLEREEELTVLAKAVTETQSGSGGLVLVDGLPGTGTSVLLHRLADTAASSGFLVLRSGGAPGERAVAFGVMCQLVLPLLAETDGAPPLPWAAPCPDRTAGDRPEPPGSAEFADALHWLHVLLAGTSAERPVLLAVDDLGWVDAPTLHALAHLAARLRGTRLLMAVVRKDGASAGDPLVRDIAAAATHRVQARPLSHEAARSLVADRFGPSCPEEFASSCHELTGGRPKDLRVLCDRARLRRLGAPGWQTERLRELGRSLRRERLLTLLRREPMVEAFAKAAAVLGDHATDELVGRIAGLSRRQCDQVRHVLSVTCAGRADDDPAHPVRTVADIVSRAMGVEESSRLHREASAVLDTWGADPETVVAPLLHVDRLGGPWEIHQLRMAAAAARRRNAPDAAVTYLGRALADVAPSSQVRAELLFELGFTEVEMGSAAAARHLAQSARLMPRIMRQAEVVASTPMHLVGGDPQLAELVDETATALGPPPEADRLGTSVAMRLEARARYAGLHEPRFVASAAQRLRELDGRPAQPSSAEQELRTVLLFAAAVGGQAAHHDIAGMARQVLVGQAAHASLTGPALELLPPVFYTVDEPEAAASWLDVAWLCAVEEGSAGLMAKVEAQRGLLLLARGEAALARHCGRRAVTLAEGAREEERQPSSLLLGRVALEVGDTALAEQVLEAVEYSADLRIFALQRALWGLRAEERGDLPVALAHYLDCGRVLERVGWLNPAIADWQARTALVQHRLGRSAEARGTAEVCHERARRWGAPTLLGRSLRVLGTLTEGPRGLALLEEAVDVLETGGSRLEFAHALTALGRRRQRASDAAGDRLVNRGRRLAAELRNGTVDTGSGTAGRPARAVAVGLTPAETRVVERAVNGLGNAAIAEELGISVRAVEMHLTNSYRKLGISGRRELSSALGRS